MCVICLDADASPAPMQSGCACRGEAGLAHVGCRVRAAEAQAQHRGRVVWRKCQTCKQHFTGEMQRGLADAWWAQVSGRAEDDAERDFLLRAIWRAPSGGKASSPRRRR